MAHVAREFYCGTPDSFEHVFRRVPLARVRALGDWATVHSMWGGVIVKHGYIAQQLEK